mmetsp:Transcript_2081/g.2854  ORF Transcript_2081/g.2854 Transcript_2081/m.2854 type:complete len:105 (+) Transcript_2081:1267-1581(+)
MLEWPSCAGKVEHCPMIAQPLVVINECIRCGFASSLSLARSLSLFVIDEGRGSPIACFLSLFLFLFFLCRHRLFREIENLAAQFSLLRLSSTLPSSAIPTTTKD